MIAAIGQDSRNASYVQFWFVMEWSKVMYISLTVSTSIETIKAH